MAAYSGQRALPGSGGAASAAGHWLTGAPTPSSANVEASSAGAAWLAGDACCNAAVRAERSLTGVVGCLGRSDESLSHSPSKEEGSNRSSNRRSEMRCVAMRPVSSKE